MERALRARVAREPSGPSWSASLSDPSWAERSPGLSARLLGSKQLLVLVAFGKLSLAMAAAVNAGDRVLLLYSGDVAWYERLACEEVGQNSWVLAGPDGTLCVEDLTGGDGLIEEARSLGGHAAGSAREVGSH